MSSIRLKAYRVELHRCRHDVAVIRVCGISRHDAQKEAEKAGLFCTRWKSLGACYLVARIQRIETQREGKNHE